MNRWVTGLFAALTFLSWATRSRGRKASSPTEISRPWFAITSSRNALTINRWWKATWQTSPESWARQGRQEPRGPGEVPESGPAGVGGERDRGPPPAARNVQLAVSEREEESPPRHWTDRQPENLQYLQLSDNQLRDLTPLEKLGNLRYLYLSNNRIEDLGPLAALKGLCSLYVDGNQVSDVRPVARLEKLETLDLRGNQVADISPLRNLTSWKYFGLDHNRISDLRVLIDMAQRDQAAARRFAPFWNVSLSGNPLSAEARQSQLGQLRQVSKSVTFED